MKSFVIALGEQNGQTVQENRDELRVPFTRVAQLQAELDAIKKALQGV